MVIPAMDRVDKDFATRLSQTNAALLPETSAAVQAALALGKKTMNKYYECTDYSELYWITMSTFFSFTSDSRLIVALFSSSPLPQASLLQKTEVAGRLDRDCTPAC
jgi:hypothetical protein